MVFSIWQVFLDLLVNTLKYIGYEFIILLIINKSIFCY